MENIFIKVIDVQILKFENFVFVNQFDNYVSNLRLLMKVVFSNAHIKYCLNVFLTQRHVIHM
jgi:hypothetical protein